MTAGELKKKYLDFFASKGHAVISGASLVPEHDPSVLFTTAGMHPLVPYLLGEKHPAGKRLVDIQKCVRTDDIDEVGDFTHHTFFEMLGNWSLGDYFKKEAISWSWEFLTSPQWLGLDPKRIAVSVFAGDADAPKDDEAVAYWLEASKNALRGRIDYLPKEKNWWGPAGQTGPCGPDTEMFYWVGKAAPPSAINPGDLADSPDWVEIWNDVFMQYNKTQEGTYEPLQQKNVDTGMGLERTLAALNGLSDDYQTDLFLPIIKTIEALSGKTYQGSPAEDDYAMRVIADHARAAVFLLAEGLEPSNTERGYIVRRLIRRAVRYALRLGIAEHCMDVLTGVVVGMYQEQYPELQDASGFIQEQVAREEERFRKTLGDGVGRIAKFAQSAADVPAFVFDMYQSYGFPLELSLEELRRNGISFNQGGLEASFREQFKKHQELSRAGAEQKFKGGLADHSQQSTKYHTATHLLQAALRAVVGDHVFQKGSNITAERLRFDFPHPDAISNEQLKTVEQWVNDRIKEDLQVQGEEMTLEQAKHTGALGVFESRYGERVKVYSIGSPGAYLSREICGGPHVGRTGELGQFKIVKLESIGQGTKRIKAVLV